MAQINKKEDILHKAALLFHQKGYSATSMRELAAAVGIEASSLYNHISSKEELLTNICFLNAKKFSEGMNSSESIDASPSSKLSMLIKQHIDIALEDKTSMTVFDDEWKHLSEPHLSSFLQTRKEYQKRFCNIIEEGIKKGEIQNLPPNLIMNTIISSLRWIHFKPESAKKVNSIKLHEQIVSLLLNGIAIKQ